MIDTTLRQEVRDGRYIIIGMEDGYRLMEKFGAYRMLKKRFRTVEAAIKRAEIMP